MFTRSSGILLHPTSLPGPYGIGDFGPAAYRFAEDLAKSGQRLWQMLPLGPTGYGDSPYQCFSAFAGNPLLISPELLAERGYVSRDDLAQAPQFDPACIDYAAVIHWKLPLLRRAFEQFERTTDTAERAEFEQFRERERRWLDDFALFMALKESHGQEYVWTAWPRDAAQRLRGQLSRQIRLYSYLQFEFFRQFEALRTHCRARQIRLVGDLPIYVAHDGADVWSHPELFELKPNGEPAFVAGVPPDYFSATGQLWGNPIYDWEALRAQNFEWWVERLRAAFAMFDLVRFDHFRGLEAYWRIPAGEPTAIDGQWVKAPGAEMLAAAENTLGSLPIIAENLGVITPDVEAIRERFNLPGMAILQFAFGSDPQGPDFRPHNYPRSRVAYTGTHDNDTTVGWWESTGAGDSTRSPDEVAREKQFALHYLNSDGREINWAMIRCLMASVADTVLIPLQDVIGLGSEARMNQPATTSGNWQWRFTQDQFTGQMQQRLRELTETYGRG